GKQPALRSPTGQQPALRSPTGQQPAVKSPPGQLPALRSPTGQQPAVRSPKGPQATINSPTGTQPALRGPSGTMNVVKGPGDLPSMDSGPLGTPGALLPSLETKPEPRLMRKPDEGLSPLQPTSLPDSGPSTLSPFAAALQVSGPTQVASDAPKHANVPGGRPVTLDSGPVPLPPPPGEDLPIDEPSGLVNLSHVSKPSLSHPLNQAKSSPVVETFGGVAVTPSKPTPAPQPIVVSPGRAGAPGWLKWAALAGASATVALLIVVVVLMGRKPTVIVVPPAPTIDDGKKVADKPITIIDPDSPQKPGEQAAASPADTKRAQKRPPSSARSGTTPKPPAENLSSSQRNLASLYRDDGNEHGATRPAGSADNARGGGAQVSQQAIMSVVTQNRRSLNLCYDRVLKHDSSLKSGRVVTHVRIGISGSVTGVSVPDPQYANSEIGQCIAQTIKHWHFPSADAEYETEFPIILQAN
ncbi:MAG: AgmX/PglI C-terminal domain-containing protein, partial [Polyangia bacterium]